MTREAIQEARQEATRNTRTTATVVRHGDATAARQSQDLDLQVTDETVIATMAPKWTTATTNK